MPQASESFQAALAAKKAKDAQESAKCPGINGHDHSEVEQKYLYGGSEEEARILEGLDHHGMTIGGQQDGSVTRYLLSFYIDTPNEDLRKRGVNLRIRGEVDPETGTPTCFMEFERKGVTHMAQICLKGGKVEIAPGLTKRDELEQAIKGAVICDLNKLADQETMRDRAHDFIRGVDLQSLELKHRILVRRKTVKTLQMVDPETNTVYSPRKVRRELGKDISQDEMINNAPIVLNGRKLYPAVSEVNFDRCDFGVEILDPEVEGRYHVYDLGRDWELEAEDVSHADAYTEFENCELATNAITHKDLPAEARTAACYKLFSKMEGSLDYHLDDHLYKTNDLDKAARGYALYDQMEITRERDADGQIVSNGLYLFGQKVDVPHVEVPALETPANDRVVDLDNRRTFGPSRRFDKK